MRKTNNCLSPSIIASDYSRLGETLLMLDDEGVPYAHIDVMDGMFVPNITVGWELIADIRNSFEGVFDAHLMINEPDRYVEDFARAGCDIITVHAESATHLDRTIDHIKSMDVMAGVALNPATPLSAIEYVLPMLDMVLIMTVNPGFSGQRMIDYTIDKIYDLRRMIDERGLSLDIEVDGGITLDNVGTVLSAGANIIVCGSSVFKGDVIENIRDFMALL